MEITLLIPTLNRLDFLLRGLRYYQSVQFRGRVIIGDSSEPTIAEKTREHLRRFEGLLDIQHHLLPGCRIARALKILADKATTRYVAFIGDDDFLIPSGIEQCVKFLDAHTDYVAAHGVGLMVNLNSIKTGEILGTEYYRQPVISEATASQRLTTHLTDYSVSLFSVHRIETWTAMFCNAGDVPDTAFGAELLPCCLSAILGKIKQLDGLYLVRQNHDSRNFLPLWFKWITRETWHPSYAAFLTHLAEAIACRDQISMEEAKGVVSLAFSVYLARCIPRDPSKWRSMVKQIPGVRGIWNALRLFCANAVEAEMHSLRKLTKPGSLYYDDFMPIYRIVAST